MASDLNLLIPEFRVKVEQLLENCRNQGVIMKPYCTLRDPYAQARLWRQSRSKAVIQKKINELKEKEAPFLAHCIESVGPQSGPHVTNAIPGLSWHQWGVAVDCYWSAKGLIIWDINAKVAGINGYQVYAAESTKLGLNSGYYWSKAQDVPHIQSSSESSPLAVHSLIAISNLMVKFLNRSSQYFQL